MSGDFGIILEVIVTAMRKGDTMALDFIYLIIITLTVLSFSVKLSETVIKLLLKRLFRSGI